MSRNKTLFLDHFWVMLFGPIILVATMIAWSTLVAFTTTNEASDKKPSITAEQRQQLEDLTKQYFADPAEFLFQDCLTRIPEDLEFGDTFPMVRRIRMAKSAYEWSTIELETDVHTDQRYFEIAFGACITDCPFPYLRGRPNQPPPFAMFGALGETKYEPGTDGRIEWDIIPKREYGRKSITLKFRCVRS